MTKILWTGPINGLGYGQASAGYAAGLLHHKALAGHVNIGDVNPDDPEVMSGECTSQIVKAKLPDSANVKGETPSVGFWHFTHSHEIANGTPRIIMSTFEVDDFPPPVIEALNKFDAIGTASTWGEKILKTHFPDKHIFSSPHAFSLMGNHPVSPHASREARLKKWSENLGFNLKDDTQIISNIGKFETRKGHYELLDTVIEIGKTRPILLAASWFNPFMKGHYPSFAMHARDMTPVLTDSLPYVYEKGQAIMVLLPRVSSKDGLIDIMRNTDTYVSASYCEGWDLPLFEMMSHGMHCIATLNTAHIDYCDKKNTTPMTTFKVEKAKDDTPFFSGNGTWNKICPNELRHCIDLAHTMGEDKRRTIGNAAEVSCRKFSWAKSASKIIQTVETVQSSMSITTQPSGPNV